METKMNKLYNLLTKIIPFVFAALGILSIVLIVLTPFKFDLLSLDINVLKEVFSDFEFYLGDNVISIPYIICFVAFTLFEVVMLIMMLVYVIIVIVNSFKFLKNQQYEERKELFAKFSKKALLVMALGSLVVVMNTVLGGVPVAIKAVILALNGAMFAISVAMDLVFDKLINPEKMSWLETGLSIGKRVLAYVTALILLLSLNKFFEIFDGFVRNTENDTSVMFVIVGALMSMAIYITIVIMAMKAYRKVNTRGAFAIVDKKKNPYKTLFITGIVVLVLSIVFLVGYQLLNFEKFESVGQLFTDLNSMMLVPVLASVSMIVVGVDKEKGLEKDKKKEEVVATVEPVNEQ